ncbi:uncharacterized protein LOC108442580 isoform X2 [Pygocentrus nattereri]|uniref:uncharacterized protein LOC108442580 isoform X2 n=1 Tax=Pygocentrus nattereri TaxID=42514 RepID=UPI0018915557|nr:uncharacterized protein LOC108442580 isoform X2 [Pygocentrus nattereri]XP_017578182.2 uncharacterized protein LOC108442580 isoform X2 [Pygocentrus nattereri]XP_017578183.2 uncharacterized protein LOC108442580 isoform X2 [Pygocentrus nattereri]XP_037402354.1 uncharacterized protein LOC108442580 isoform X2 [Pygocentrus nattereri]XP_037402355.1 uncharacterized protein LOC108442580 isoform X2 [Pygocentrus nattereri]XP_037402356.1 uncharacterized protein LOC108442580 isoform X2 [Pygocentrus natt
MHAFVVLFFIALGLGSAEVRVNQRANKDEYTEEDSATFQCNITFDMENVQNCELEWVIEDPDNKDEIIEMHELLKFKGRVQINSNSTHSSMILKSLTTNDMDVFLCSATCTIDQRLKVMLGKKTKLKVKGFGSVSMNQSTNKDQYTEGDSALFQCNITFDAENIQRCSLKWVTEHPDNNKIIAMQELQKFEHRVQIDSNSTHSSMILKSLTTNDMDVFLCSATCAIDQQLKVILGKKIKLKVKGLCFYKFIVFMYNVSCIVRNDYRESNFFFSLSTNPNRCLAALPNLWHKSAVFHSCNNYLCVHSSKSYKKKERHR